MDKDRHCHYVADELNNSCEKKIHFTCQNITSIQFIFPNIKLFLSIICKNMKNTITISLCNPRQNFTLSDKEFSGSIY